MLKALQRFIEPAKTRADGRQWPPLLGNGAERPAFQIGQQSNNVARRPAATHGCLKIAVDGAHQFRHRQIRRMGGQVRQNGRVDVRPRARLRLVGDLQDVACVVRDDHELGDALRMKRA